MTETLSYINHSLKDVYTPGEIRSFTQLIMEHVTGLQRHQFLMGKDNELSGTKQEEVRRIVERLMQSEPIQYIIGKTSFYGLTFNVTPAVLIPRPETEELTDRIVKDGKQGNGRILDIGTGSGCIAITLSHYLPNYQTVAVDISEEALSVAGENARLNQTAVSFIRTDILSPQALSDIEGMYDIIVSNPPYVKESEKAVMEKNVLEYEPSLALFVPDTDPLLFYRVIAEFGKEKLNKGGFLYFETNAQYGKETAALLEETGYTNVELIRDLSGKDRMIKAQR